MQKAVLIIGEEREYGTQLNDGLAEQVFRYNSSETIEFKADHCINQQQTMNRQEFKGKWSHNSKTERNTIS